MSEMEVASLHTLLTLLVSTAFTGNTAYTAYTVAYLPILIATWLYGFVGFGAKVSVVVDGRMGWDQITPFTLLRLLESTYRANITKAPSWASQQERGERPGVFI